MKQNTGPKKRNGTTTATWWTHSGSISDAYVNNRHLPQGNTWQYDADGRLLTDPNTYKTYDAAGRNIYLDTCGCTIAQLRSQWARPPIPMSFPL